MPRRFSTRLPAFRSTIRATHDRKCTGALLAGGVSFATPPKPGHTVSEGSVFQLHPEAKKDWLEWETDYTAKKDDGEKKEGAIARFFHHEDKPEEEAKQDDPTPEPSADEHKHGFMHRLFHRGD